MKNQKKIRSIFIVVALLFSAMLILSGCSSTLSTSSGNVLVKSADGSISLSVPAGWNTKDTNPYPSAVIGVSSNTDYQHVIVTKRPKSNLPANSTLNIYMADVKKVYSVADTNLVWGQISNVTIGGCHALTVELNATNGSKDLVYWISAIEGQDNYYCVSGWTTTNLADKDKPVIENVINSFKAKT
jgi:hypothetical protein